MADFSINNLNMNPLCVKRTVFSGQSQKKSVFEMPKTESNKEFSKTQAGLIAGGVALTTVAAIILTKGKKSSFLKNPISQLKSLFKRTSCIKLTEKQSQKLGELVAKGQVKKEYAEIFKKTQHLEGKKFVKEVYKELSNLMGFTPETAPKLHLTQSGDCGNGIDGISINIRTWTDKKSLFGAIRHELEHAKQDEFIYRAFGKKGMIKAHRDRLLRKLIHNPQHCIEVFGTEEFKNVPREKVLEYLKFQDQRYETKLGKFEELLRLKGPIAKGTPEYLKAKDYLNASKNYLTPDMGGFKDFPAPNATPFEKVKFLHLLSGYESNLLEAEARKAQRIMENSYNIFNQIIKM